MRFAFRGELVLALFFTLIGALWILRALRMPLWEGFAPDSGFLPLVYGVLLATLAAVVLLQLALAKDSSNAETIRKPLVVTGALVGAVAALPIAGFVISVFALLLFLYAGVERLRLVTSGIAAAAITGFLYLVFKVWLGVPLP
ncbi:MAG TPA: tripartite tricarboxylate transporter TctB family protein [Burkholderiales bacterium]